MSFYTLLSFGGILICIIALAMLAMDREYEYRWLRVALLVVGANAMVIGAGMEAKRVPRESPAPHAQQMYEQCVAACKNNQINFK